MDRDLTAMEIAMLRQQLEMERERKLRLEQEAREDQLRLEIAQRNDQRMREYEELFRAEQERQEAERLERMRVMEEQRLNEKKQLELRKEDQMMKAEQERIHQEENIKRKEVENAKMLEEQKKRQQDLKDMIAKKAQLIQKTSENIRKREEAKAFEVEMKKAEAARNIEEQRKMASKDYGLELKKAEAITQLEEQKKKAEEERLKAEEEKKKEEEEKTRNAMKENLLKMVREQREKLKVEVKNDAKRIERWKTLTEKITTTEIPKGMIPDLKVLDAKAMEEAAREVKQAADSTSGKNKSNSLTESFRRSLKLRDKDTRNYRDRLKSPESYTPLPSAKRRRERSRSRERHRGRSRSKERRSSSRERKIHGRERRSRSKERRRGRSHSRERKRSQSPARDRSRRKRSRSGSKSRDRRKNSPGRTRKRSQSRSPPRQSHKHSRRSSSKDCSQSPPQHDRRRDSPARNARSPSRDVRRSRSPQPRPGSDNETTYNGPKQSSALSLIQSYDAAGNVDFSDDLLASVSSALQSIQQTKVLEFTAGMLCPLAACAEQPCMYKPDQLITHWNEFHSIRTTSYLCRVCQIHRHQSWESRSRGQIFRHFFTEHPVAVEGHTVENLPMMHIAVIKEQNLSYIDPGLYELHSSMRSPEDDPLPPPSLRGPAPQSHSSYPGGCEDNRSARSTSIGARSRSHLSRSRSPSRTRSVRSRSRSLSPKRSRKPTERKIEVRFRPNIKCPAEGCQYDNRGTFLKLSNFMKHWVNIHFPMNYYKICLLCEKRGYLKQAKRVRDLIRHFHKDHRTCDAPFKYRSELKFNESFIHPGRFFISQQLLQLAREEATCVGHEMDLEETGPFPTDEEMEKAKEPREIREICRREKAEILVYGKGKNDDRIPSDDYKDWSQGSDRFRSTDGYPPHDDYHSRGPPRDDYYDHDRGSSGQDSANWGNERDDHRHPPDWDRWGDEREAWRHEGHGRGYGGRPDYRGRGYHQGPPQGRGYPPRPGPHRSGPPDGQHQRYGPPNDHFQPRGRGRHGDWNREHSPGHRYPSRGPGRPDHREQDEWDDRREWDYREHRESGEHRERHENWENHDNFRGGNREHDYDERLPRDDLDSGHDEPRGREKTGNGRDMDSQAPGDQPKTDDIDNKHKQGDDKSGRDNEEAPGSTNKESGRDDEEAPGNTNKESTGDGEEVPGNTNKESGSAGEEAPRDTNNTEKEGQENCTKEATTGQAVEAAIDGAASDKKTTEGPPSQKSSMDPTAKSEPPSGDSDESQIIIIKYFKDMPCPVEHCKKYSDIRYAVRAQFMYHWGLHHRKECTYYTCRVCEQQGYRRQRTHQLDEMRRHFLRSHASLRWVPPTPTNMEFVLAERKPTEEYIDPGIYRF